jgi:type VI secretion system protein ImpG
MDPRILDQYNRELQFIREMGGEFAREYPKIAGRLGMDGLECADPYVERLLEGFAFLAARVQVQLKSEYPKFTQQLLEIVYPNFLSPTPSMAVVQFQPDLAEGALAEGFVVPRGTTMRSVIGKGDKTACEYRTAHDTTLWPLELTEARYFSSAGALATTGIDQLSGVRAGIRLRLRTTAGLAFNELALDSLRFFLDGSGELPTRVYEQIVGNAIGFIVQPKGGSSPWSQFFEKVDIHRVGFGRDESLLPPVAHAFTGYRLLREYFAFTQRFLFVDFRNLQKAIRRCSGTELDITVLLNRSDPFLEDLLNENAFAMNCTPAINLIEKRATRIHLNERFNEYHVVPDRTRPLDFETYSVTSVAGFGRSAEPEVVFKPFYTSNDYIRADGDLAYYTTYREPRRLSSRQKRDGARSSYIGSELFVSLVDGHEAPFRSSLRQLEVMTLCTNRDLPLQIPVGRGSTDFTLDTGAPVTSIRALAGPTRPLPSRADGDAAWRLISQLSLNYLSIGGAADGESVAALQKLLSLYADMRDSSIQKQIEGIQAVSSRTITRRLPAPGPITYGRGLEVSLTCDDDAYEGTGVFLLSAVLEEFFARYASINSFTETVINTPDRGEVMRWPGRLGRRQTL